MENIKEPKFENPTLSKRLKGMMGVDFYRLFHTPMFYIFLAIAAIIPAMVLTMTGGEEGVSMYSNTWEIIAASSPLYKVSNMGEYANMNMVFIFGGIMISIFIGHDYRSGYVKQLFTTHPKKMDYMVSKSTVGAFSMASMCTTYLIGSIVAGMMSGMKFDINFGNLISSIIGKMLMSFGWASLYTFINVVFRRHFGISILLSFILGTGIEVIGAGAIIGNSSLLNVFLYGSSVYACLSSNFITILTCLLVSLIWTLIYNLIGSFVLSKCDVY